MCARAHATTARAILAIEELTQRSDLVVHGTVSSMRSSMEDGRIFTTIDVTPTEIVKGAPSTRHVTLKLYGGVFNGMRTMVIGAPCISNGEEIVAFLKANSPSTYDLVNLAEGKFSVIRDGGSSPAVERDLRGIHYLDPHTIPHIPATLDELLSMVRSANR
jgi:hypothetical protein